ncbi:toll/interleukin-1 receptor domain-containing protein [Escherichia coli]|uniref:toll/interleukin-1 receptor domain-containing protein n=1 Tax=Escherichia coli TaxID=562 RepID=UPI00052E0600|nr:toll/interleukin-1 receptor domain-containing protein [Escherichia coli]EFE0690304.1 toll/interleukin-1 receptor domain-containing protein [Escherichia coli]EIA0558223.1 toll/interleukin-1 receptor domain-containing protein [Escherichia coli]KGM62340.1 hypothetical protein EL76_0806 [Escherichia coli G3/10]QNJ68028.1 toll/interleukin-1 receptor domain-containing protein [Escherichia coli]HCQ0195384.1 toll/interleukin-1 receptor domain-containing protein [Escherichia coli]
MQHDQFQSTGQTFMSSRMPKSLYQCLIFGQSTPEQVTNIKKTISNAMEGFGLQPDEHFTITVGFEGSFVETAPSVALFFGGVAPSLSEHAELMRLSIPIIPLVSDVANVANELPECLRSLNALALAPEDIELIKPAGVALQCLGLLPTQRRVFVSYRRTESRDVAVQLFEALSARQFEVFLDTHSVGAAVDFQSVLWHRLCDCDVVVMLDTPGFFDSRWARAEWGRATDKHISILQVLWPGHTASRTSALATPRVLSVDDFVEGKLTDEVIDSLSLQVEGLRSKSVALRHANIAGHLRSSIESMGGAVEAIGIRRSLVLRLPSGNPLVAHPSVGVPTAVTLHDAMRDNDSRPAILVYDHVGLSEEWMTHLNWLGTNVKGVQWIKSRQAGWELSELEGL